MFATFINCAAVILGSLVGLLIAGKIKDEYRSVIHIGAGGVTLVIGMGMAFESQKVLYLALSLLAGGIVGTWWAIDAGILRLGHFLERLTMRKKASPAIAVVEGAVPAGPAVSAGADAPTGRTGWDFGRGFLNSSVLFCVGAMAIVGSFEAGTGGSYTTLLTKSVLDGFMSILFAAAMGPGVIFSALPILVYQGALTLGASAVKPWVSTLMLGELKGVGGALILMIGLNLLELKVIKTANFLPALLLMVAFVLLDPFVIQLGALLGIGG